MIEHNRHWLYGVSLTITLILSVTDSRGQIPRNVAHSPVFTTQSKEQPSHPKEPDLHVIVPGMSVGPLQLGASRERALQLFPRKPPDTESWQPGGCGTEYIWVDSENRPIGNLFIYFSSGSVSQIVSATTRFRTAEGLSIYDSPGDVRNIYRNGVRTYVLLNHSSRATGDRPLVYWVVREKGIAFVFGYSLTERVRYLYSIVIFKADTDFCPQDAPAKSSDFREIAPYSLEGPNRGA